MSEETDRFGLRVAHVSFHLHANDNKLIHAAKSKTMEVMQAAGATEAIKKRAMLTWSAPPAWVLLRAHR